MKRIIFSHLIPTVLIAGGMLTSCTYEEIKPERVVIPDSVKFSVNIIPVFNTSCNTSGCHSKGGISPDLSAANAYTSLSLLGYVDPEDPEGSVIYQKITTGTMKVNAKEQDKALILQWIKQGALDN